MRKERRTVLLVDDDVDFLAIGERALNAVGFSVLTASGRDEAMARLEAEMPDVIVSDLMMGSLDEGFAFARELKSDTRYASIPVVIVTSVSRAMGFDFTPRSDADLSAMGADAFLEKPVTPSTLARTVADLAAAARW